MDRELYINAVMGCVPSYSQMGLQIVKQCGHYVGGFTDSWKWDRYSINELNDKELLELYNIVKG